MNADERKQAENILDEYDVLIAYGSGTRLNVLRAMETFAKKYAALKVAEKELELEEKKNCRTCNELGHSCWLHDSSNPDNKVAEATKEMYPKDFIEWREINATSDRISKTKVRYSINDFDAPLGWYTLDELFDYWKQNIQA